MSNMAINTNVLALNSHRSLKGVGAKQEKASTRLSSGYRINSAADDAAGLAISEKMRAQIRGLDMASKNSQDAISLIQTAEGGMQEIDNMLQRIRELTVQASNDTNDQTVEGGSSQEQGDRVKIQDEINQLVAEIDSMADRVEFNKKKVINGSYSKGTAVEKQALATAKDGLAAAIKDITDSIADETGSGELGTLLKAVIDTAAAVTDPADLDQAGKTAISNAIKDFKAAAKTAKDATSFKTAFDNLNTALSGVTIGTSTAEGTAAGAAMTALLDEFATAGPSGHYASVEAAGGAAFDAEVDVKTAKEVINMSSSEGLYFQVGANSDQKMELSISSVKSDMLGIGDGNGTASISVIEASGTDINAILDQLDTALTYVTTERSKLGAAQNRLEYTQKSLDISSENLTASESRIRDTDMAKEMMNFTQANVLQQAATSMLAQANQSKQGILQLLQ